MSQNEFDELVRTLEFHKTVVLTGAGCSTESGIPDYRGPKTRRKARKPITFQEFEASEDTRRRYWARSARGWPKFSSARPNRAHEALADLEQQGVLSGLITQNVDGLHQAAGSGSVVELHGTLAEVVCLVCGERETRADVQRRIEAANPDWIRGSGELAPDGDADVTQGMEDFVAPECLDCGGRLKPDVVFFGENVPPAVHSAAWSLFDDAEALLVVGSSLTVTSGYRFAKRAALRHMPTAIINVGPTRADSVAWIRIDAWAGSVLPRLAAALRGE